MSGWGSGWGIDSITTAGAWQRHSGGRQLVGCEADAVAAVPRLFASNRRDGSRLLSSALVITGIGLVRVDHPAGQVVAAVGAVVSLYWWLQYRQLQR